MYTPKISIVIPAYNASNYLSEAIESALAQTYPNLEIIVVNDGSEDNGATESIARSYGERIRYFSKENGGSSSALNMGIANMTGEWFSWLSHDDLYVPEKLEKQVAYIRRLQLNPEELPRHIFFSASELIDASGKTIRASREKTARELAGKVASFPHNGYLIAEPATYSFHGCSCLIHRAAFECVGNFDKKLRLVNDIDMWFRLFASGYHVHYIPESLVKGRIHAKQISISAGYSYHNSEQDMFWKRSLAWLQENYPVEKELFFLFGRNAYLKTRNAEGDMAFAYIMQISPSARWKCRRSKVWYKSYAALRSRMKKIYLSLKV